MGHFISNFKLKLLNKWICFIIRTSYLTRESSYFQNFPKCPALFIRILYFFPSLCQQCFTAGLVNGTLNYREEFTLTQDHWLLMDCRATVSVLVTYRKFKCIRLNNSNFKYLQHMIVVLINCIWLKLIYFGEGGLEIVREIPNLNKVKDL